MAPSHLAAAALCRLGESPALRVASPGPPGLRLRLPYSMAQQVAAQGANTSNWVPGVSPRVSPQCLLDPKPQRLLRERAWGSALCIRAKRTRGERKKDRVSLFRLRFNVMDLLDDCCRVGSETCGWRGRSGDAERPGCRAVTPPAQPRAGLSEWPSPRLWGESGVPAGALLCRHWPKLRVTGGDTRPAVLLPPPSSLRPPMRTPLTGPCCFLPSR